ncbi:hypothetical protein SAMN04488523_12033 [Sulfitobacter brevis]|jgi:hypothetical protein|uniref:Uncharacterized protein n=1 Tax=Sulfitobacter brevis TaxID=74348 RepID=A0A1I2G802_9RHOB|nr:hypothetical protein SAMN04488523_12033 [Sulfitobacter brevis]
MTYMHDTSLTVPSTASHTARGPTTLCKSIISTAQKLLNPTPGHAYRQKTCENPAKLECSGPATACYLAKYKAGTHRKSP